MLHSGDFLHSMSLQNRYKILACPKKLGANAPSAPPAYGHVSVNVYNYHYHAFMGADRISELEGSPKQNGVLGGMVPREIFIFKMRFPAFWWYFRQHKCVRSQ